MIERHTIPVDTRGGEPAGGSKPPAPLFTVFVPTFNRVHTLERTLESIARQRFRDFELLVVDDGSDDGTAEWLACWLPESGLHARHVRKANGGKHTAHNLAVQLAAGELLALVDSDDLLLAGALCQLAAAWHAIPPAQRHAYAGVEGLCVRSDGTLHGGRFPENTMDSNHLEMTRHYGVTGEKRNALRVDVLRQYPYPRIPGERHVRPSHIWREIAHSYRLRYINQVLQVVDFRDDGLTRTARARRLQNPEGLYRYHRDDLLRHPQYHNRAQRRRVASQYVRYALHAGHGLRYQWREVRERRLWLSALPRGLQDWLLDTVKRRRVK